MGVDVAGQPPAHRRKKFVKKPIGNTLDRCNLRRHKLRKRTIRLDTLNVHGIRNKTGEIIKCLEELKQDITILTETKKKGNGVEILRPNLHFESEVSKEKRAKRGASVLVKKRYKRYIMTWETINENTIKLHMNLYGKKLCILGIYAISDDENALVKEDFLEKLNEVIFEIGNSGEILIAGDSNSKTGEKINNLVAGPFGEVITDNGDKLIDICEQISTKMLNGYFKHKRIHQYSLHKDTQELRSIIITLLPDKIQV